MGRAEPHPVDHREAQARPRAEPRVDADPDQRPDVVVVGLATQDDLEDTVVVAGLPQDRAAELAQGLGKKLDVGQEDTPTAVEDPG